MRSLPQRLAAFTALNALMACSGIGVCWLQFAPAKAHHCCHPTTTLAAAPERACTVVMTSVAATKIAPPAVGAAPPYASLLEPLRDRMPDAAFAPAYPMRSPPQVLRI